MQAISRIKVMAQLDIAERRVPQDGRLQIGYQGRSIDVRVSIMPSIHGEDAVLHDFYGPGDDKVVFRKSLPVKAIIPEQVPAATAGTRVDRVAV